MAAASPNLNRGGQAMPEHEIAVSIADLPVDEDPPADGDDTANESEKLP